MPAPLKDVLARKSPERRAAIEADARRMIEQEARQRDQLAVSLANEVLEECGDKLTREEFGQVVDGSFDPVDEAWTIYLAITDRPS